VANYLDIKGDSYKEDFSNIQQMLKDLTEIMNTSNWEGQIITHQFVGITAETIKHNIDKVPTKVISLLQETAKATFKFVSGTSENIVLESSDATLKLTFYVE